ncbi:hypothetical protein BJX65DRAFT_291222 [Aspergillus insuetus]
MGHPLIWDTLKTPHRQPPINFDSRLLHESQPNSITIWYLHAPNNDSLTYGV